MFKNSGRSGDILRSETPLTVEQAPRTPLNRTSELDYIRDAIQPITQGSKPDNLLIHGPAGIGKTTCVKHVFDEFEEQTTAKLVYINCWQYNTRPSLLTELLIQLGYPAPRKGKPVDVLLSKLKEWLNKNRGFTVALDEFDQLEDRTEIVYDLQLLNKEAKNNVGVIMVSNQHPRKLNLDPRSRSRLNCQTLEFEPYSSKQLVEILEQRVEQAFQPGSVSQEVIETVAEYVSENSGDCREALALLLRTGREVEQQGGSEITISDLEL